MHNQVKLQARNGMALLQTEKANSCDIPHCCPASHPCVGRKERRKIFKCRLGPTVEILGVSSSTAHFSAFFRNRYYYCFRAESEDAGSWVLIVSSFSSVSRRRLEVRKYLVLTPRGISVSHIIYPKRWHEIEVLSDSDLRFFLSEGENLLQRPFGVTWLLYRRNIRKINYKQGNRRREYFIIVGLRDHLSYSFSRWESQARNVRWPKRGRMGLGCWALGAPSLQSNPKT